MKAVTRSKRKNGFLGGLADGKTDDKDAVELEKSEVLLMGPTRSGMCEMEGSSRILFHLLSFVMCQRLYAQIVR